MRRDEVRVDGEPQYSESLVEVVRPDGRVPLRGPALEQLAAPDVVDEHVDVAVIGPDPVGQGLHSSGIEMVDGDRDAGPAQARDELRGFFDGLGTVVLGSSRSGTPARTNDRRARFAQGGGDAAPGPSGRARYNGDATPERVSIRRPGHGSSVPPLGTEHKRSGVVRRP